MGGKACDRNFPWLVKFNPGESKNYRTTFSKPIKFENPCQHCIYGPQIETTKLGLILLDDIFEPRISILGGYNVAKKDKSTWKIIWSNPLYLLTENEAHPKPVKIPVPQNELKLVR